MRPRLHVALLAALAVAGCRTGLLDGDAAPADASSSVRGDGGDDMTAPPTNPCDGVDCSCTPRQGCEVVVGVVQNECWCPCNAECACPMGRLLGCAPVVCPSRVRCGLLATPVGPDASGCYSSTYPPDCESLRGALLATCHVDAASVPGLVCQTGNTPDCVAECLRDVASCADFNVCDFCGNTCACDPPGAWLKQCYDRCFIR